MILNLLYLICLLASFGLLNSFPLEKRVKSNTADWNPRATPYPAVRRGSTVFQYNSEAAKGKVSVPDPYNWLETGTDVEKFKEDQFAFTKKYTDKLEDVSAILSAFKETDTYSILTAPVTSGPKEDPIYKYFYMESNETFWKTYVAKKKDLDQAAKTQYASLPGKMIIDETLLAGERSYLTQLSPDGTKVLYSTAVPGTKENAKVYVRDVSSPLIDKSQKQQEGGYGRYPDVITNLKAGTETWSKDSKSFFYTASDGSIRYHVLGTDVKNDVMVIKPNKKEGGFWWAHNTDDMKNILVYGSINVSFALGKSAFIASLDQPISSSMKWLCINPDDSMIIDQATNVGNDFYFVTSKDAPNYQVVRFSLDFSKAVQTDDLNTFTKGSESVTVIGEKKDAKIQHFVTFDNDKLFTIYQKDDRLQFLAFNLKDGSLLQELLLDIHSTSVDNDAYSLGTDIYLTIDALNTPRQFYHLNWDRSTKKFSSQIIYRQKNQGIDPEKYIVERKLAPSKNGDVKIPLYVLRRKDLKFDGSHPVIINFYGAYGFNYVSKYDNYHMAFVSSYDGIYILAAPRGGGESDDDWHRSGQLDKKQNTFDDIIAIAQYAIDQKWTSAGKLILDVQSAGAAASGAIINQAPEGLFGAFIGLLGIYDLLRSNKNIDKSSRAAEYGSPSDPKAFDWLKKWSPLHNVDAKKVYPTILLYPPSDNDRDEHVEPWQNYKFIAELQHTLSNNPNPILLGNGTDTQEVLSAIAFSLAAHTIGFERVK